MDNQLQLDGNIEYLPEKPSPNTDDNDVEDFDKKLAHKRAERDFKEEGWFYWVRVIALIIISVIGVCLVGSYTLHLFLPTRWHWLTPEQLLNMKDLTVTIVGGALIAQTTTYFLAKKK